MPDRDSKPDRCIAALVPQAAINAAVVAASKPIHDDGHTDCYYAGILLAAWPHLSGDTADRAELLRLRGELPAVRLENEQLREALRYFAIDDTAYVGAYKGPNDATVLPVAVTRLHAARLREMVESPLTADDNKAGGS